jgi:iron complex transport system substrate-binding protein
MRIVSLLPSTTEILFAVGAGDDVVGVTFECDTPATARERRIVSTSAMPEGLGPEAIDTWVAAALAAGEDLYRLDADALRDLDADLVVTQDLCAVCAVDVSVVDEALDYLGCTADVLTVDPYTVSEVLDSVLAIGERTGTIAAARALVDSLVARLATVEATVAAARAAGTTAPRVLLLEWIEPPYAPGHWIPEMVTRAGGHNVVGDPGRKSRRITWETVAASAPDLIVCAPCGYDAPAAAAQARDALALLPADVPVWAVDANASFARPGPRIVDGIEALAAIIADPTRSESDLPGSGALRVR